MKRTVKQLARLAGITPRALHYYDEIDLLPPSAVGENGYRYYDDSATLRLQQIMFYRELGLSLTDIKGVLDDPGFEIRQALLAHREALQEQAQRISTLIKTIDKTLVQLEGEQEMDAEELFGGFDNAQERKWSQEAINQYGAHDSYVQESARRWRSYTAADKAWIKEEGDAMYANLGTYVDRDPADPEVQELIAGWHQHLRYFYEPSPEMLSGLGQLYAENPDFVETFTAIDPRLPEFLRDAITYYVAGL